MTAEPSLIGREIGDRYEIVSQLGVGGMATAYLANDRRLGRRVVVKIPHPELIRQPDFRKRFQREVHSLTQLPHPGVVPLYDCGEEAGLPYCVVRYLPGGDLADRIEAAGGRQTVAEIIRWLPQIADTLDFVHHSGVIHRDVTPVNILFDDSGNVFLSDFGVAAISHAADTTEVPEMQSRLTAEGSFVGVAVYAPPEAPRRHLTPAYDQYSLALVLYHALCGYLPFAQLEPRALMVAKNSEAPAPLGERGVPIAASAVNAVMRGLSVQPEDRFPSCREFADAFTGIGIDTDVLSTPPALATRRRSLPWIAALLGLALVFAVAVVSGWPVLRPSEGTRAAQLTGSLQIGTTAAELADALQLCRAHGSPCTPDLYDDEKLLEITVGPFELDRTETTNREFASFINDTGHETTAEQLGRSRDGPFEEHGLDWRQPAGPRSSHLDLPEHPVVHVSSVDAAAYCAHVGKRLPSEAEWEFAARSQDRRVFPWGADWNPGNANWASGEGARLRAVGGFPGGPFGHVDLAGNVWEWTATHSSRIADSRVLRGGSWMETNPANLRSAVRLLAPPLDSSTDIGFRCARDIAR